eukprot:gene23805-28861_t
MGFSKYIPKLPKFPRSDSSAADSPDEQQGHVRRVSSESVLSEDDTSLHTRERASLSDPPFASPETSSSSSFLPASLTRKLSSFSSPSFSYRRKRTSGIEYLSDRLLILPFEGRPDKTSKLPSFIKPSKTSVGASAEAVYLQCLTDAAESLNANHPNGEDSSTCLLVNLSTELFLNPELYRLFGNACVEFPSEWVTPQGPGILPLEIIISVCLSIHNWLALDDTHVVGEYELVREALEGLPTPVNQRSSPSSQSSSTYSTIRERLNFPSPTRLL